MRKRKNGLKLFDFDAFWSIAYFKSKLAAFGGGAIGWIVGILIETGNFASFDLFEVAVDDEDDVFKHEELNSLILNSGNDEFDASGSLELQIFGLKLFYLFKYLHN